MWKAREDPVLTPSLVSSMEAKNANFEQANSSPKLQMFKFFIRPIGS